MIPTAAKKPPVTRKKVFGGVSYSRWSSGLTALDARNLSLILREEGYKVRVTQEAGRGHVIWRCR